MFTPSSLSGSPDNLSTQALQDIHLLLTHLFRKSDDAPEEEVDEEKMTKKRNEVRKK